MIIAMVFPLFLMFRRGTSGSGIFFGMDGGRKSTR